jgi:hypothetical protein
MSNYPKQLFWVDEAEIEKKVAATGEARMTSKQFYDLDDRKWESLNFPFHRHMRI